MIHLCEMAQGTKYCTDRIVPNKTQLSKWIAAYAHVVIDEAWEPGEVKWNDKIREWAAASGLAVGASSLRDAMGRLFDQQPGQALPSVTFDVRHRADGPAVIEVMTTIPGKGHFTYGPASAAQIRKHEQVV